MTDDFQPISYRSGVGQEDRYTSNASDSQTAQNDFVAAELRRVQQARGESALAQLLSRQQQMAAAAIDSNTRGSLLDGMTNSSSRTFLSSDGDNSAIMQMLGRQQQNNTATVDLSTRSSLFNNVNNSSSSALLSPEGNNNDLMQMLRGQQQDATAADASARSSRLTNSSSSALASSQGENNALMQMLSRQQQNAVNAIDANTRSSLFNGTTNSSNGTLRLPEGENNALMQMLSGQQQNAMAVDSSTRSSRFNSVTDSSSSSLRSSEGENSAFMQLLRGQQPNAAAAVSNPSAQFNGMTNSSGSGVSVQATQMNNFIHRSLMNNSTIDSAGGNGLNNMDSSMRLNNVNSSLGSQLNNFMTSSFMNNGMNMNGMNNVGMNQMNTNMNNVSSAATSSPSSQFSTAGLAFSQQTNNLLLQSVTDNHQGSTNINSLGTNAFINSNNQLMPSGMNNITYQHPTPQEDPGWEEQFKALRTYHLSHGNCRVPARFKENPKLGRWVMTQRRQFTLLMQGFPSALTADRIGRLEALGFTWSIRPEPASTWKRKFEELQAYKATFGNCMVPQRYQANPQLGTWVHTQRRQYRLMAEGKKTSMTKERAAALDSIGFFWAAKHSRDLPLEGGDGSDSSDRSGRAKSA